jgi:hypothetical protein
MDAQRKAEIKRTYKEQTPRKGVFRVDCSATGQTWVDASPTLDSIQNRVWFSLRMGSHHNRALQAAWNEAGPDAMHFEIVEVFPEDASGYTLERLMKERKAHWMDVLQASSCQ